MPALTTLEADYPAKRSCLSGRPIFKGFPSQSLLRATSRGQVFWLEVPLSLLSVSLYSNNSEDLKNALHSNEDVEVYLHI
jgi:hypothetical protein